MTEREKRNEEMKARIRRDAEDQCHFIDMVEMELKHKENSERSALLAYERVLEEREPALKAVR